MERWFPSFERLQMTTVNSLGMHLCSGKLLALNIWQHLRAYPFMYALCLNQRLNRREDSRFRCSRGVMHAVSKSRKVTASERREDGFKSKRKSIERACIQPR
jgi:hypothetical protein